MAAVAGEIRVGEANDVAAKVRRRQIGRPWYLVVLVLVPVLAIVFGVIEGFLADTGLLPWAPYTVGPLIGILVAGLICAKLSRAIVVRQFKAQFRKRGLPTELPIRIEVSPDHLSHRVGGVLQLADWPSVTDLFKAKGYWVFVVLGGSIYVPRRLFAGPEAERALIGEALSFMTPGARGRSPQAVAFASGQAG